jgi:hypothetical protein
MQTDAPQIQRRSLLKVSVAKEEQHLQIKIILDR